MKEPLLLYLLFYHLVFSKYPSGRWINFVQKTNLIGLLNYDNEREHRAVLTTVSGVM